jgi:predicted lipoprotein with Yx(FWY)xxD motif
MATVAVAVVLPVALADGHISRAQLKLRKTRAGMILVDGRGFTLYAFTADRPRHDACAEKPDCLTAWPAMTTGGAPIAGPGVKRALIGTIRVHGQRQVTYAGHPLYRYIADSGPGQTFYINIMQFGGRWPALNASGHEVT